MYRTFANTVFAAMLVAALCSCAKVNDTGLRLVSTRVDAFAVINGRLLTGDVILIPDRTGRVILATDADPAMTCMGAMRYTASVSGEMDLSCGDGTSTRLRYSLITETRGYAYGASALGPISVAFGLPFQEATAYLRIPDGKRLVPSADGGAAALQ
jgi:hypothetical protein